MLTCSRKNRLFLSHMGAQGALGQAVYDMAKDGGDFFVVSADLAVASGFSRFMEEYSDNFINVGIAEQNLISVAAGMAQESLPVIATSWGAFASYRCADQIRNFLGFMNANVKVVGMGSGMAISRFGGSHYGIGDLSLMRGIPGLTIIAPCDGIEIYYAVYEAMKTKNPTYVRLTGGDRLPIINKDSQYRFEIGKANVLLEGEDVLIVACGTLLEECIRAAEILSSRQISSTILNMHTIKPLDVEAITGRLTHKLIVTIEEHNTAGGLGGAVAEALAGVADKPKHILLGIDDFVPLAGDYCYLLEKCGLLAMQIADRISNALEM